MEKKIFTITIVSQNTPGVLYRIAGMFLRRKINIESLHVKATSLKTKAKFIIKVTSKLDIVKVMCKQMEKIVEVEEVVLK